jgi:hypothetical protein
MSVPGTLWIHFQDGLDQFPSLLFGLLVIGLKTAFRQIVRDRMAVAASNSKRNRELSHYIY